MIHSFSATVGSLSLKPKPGSVIRISDKNPLSSSKPIAAVPIPAPVIKTAGASVYRSPGFSTGTWIISPPGPVIIVPTVGSIGFLSGGTTVEPSSALNFSNGVNESLSDNIRTLALAPVPLIANINVSSNSLSFASSLIPTTTVAESALIVNEPPKVKFTISDGVISVPNNL